MGFSSNGEASTGSATGDKYQKQTTPSFGQRIENYFQDRYPVAGGLAGKVFGGDQQNQNQVSPQYTQALPTQMQKLPEFVPPDFSMLMQNAQPKSDGGLKTLAKFFMGG